MSSLNLRTLFNNKAPIPVPESARGIHDRIINCLNILAGLENSTVLSPKFLFTYREFLEQFERYQKAVLSACREKITCRRGCSSCCYHWVVDVNSFEGEMIADYIRKQLSEKIDWYILQLRDDCNFIETLSETVETKLADHVKKHGSEEFDELDVLLSSFYQFKRRCPFLGENGECDIYPVRPLTCRIYVSFSDPQLCAPDKIQTEDALTYLLDMEENASEILDALHFKYIRYEGDSGLRSMLLKLLQEPARDDL